jgi:hypothetical protein
MKPADVSATASCCNSARYALPRRFILMHAMAQTCPVPSRTTCPADMKPAVSNSANAAKSTSNQVSSVETGETASVKRVRSLISRCSCVSVWLSFVKSKLFISGTFSAYFYFAGVAAGFARLTGVCFSTWLAVAHSASLAGLFL